MLYKTCSACKNTLPETGEYFTKNPKGKKGLRSVCKVCTYIKEMIMRKYHREKKPWTKSIEKEYKRYLRMIYTTYKISEQDLRDWVDLQNGCCVEIAIG